MNLNLVMLFVLNRGINNMIGLKIISTYIIITTIIVIYLDIRGKKRLKNLDNRKGESNDRD